MVSKSERAIIALRECADALEAMPIRRVSILGPFISTTTLRQEADWYEAQLLIWEEASKE